MTDFEQTSTRQWASNAAPGAPLPARRMWRALHGLCLRSLMVALAFSTASAFASGCKVAALAEIPITVDHLRPTMTAQINGVDVRLLLDSGAFYSMISDASAAQLKLKTAPAPVGMYVRGVHGGTGVSLTTVQSLTLAGVPLHNIEFLVGGTEVGGGSVGLLGQNILSIGDVEYDFSNGSVRLMLPQDCGNAMLAYWVDKETPYSVINLRPGPEIGAQGTGTHIARKALSLSSPTAAAYVNGVEIRVVFDSGAATSVLSLKAAERAGIKPDSPGVTSAGVMFGIGSGSSAAYIAPFSSFKIGEEEIKSTHLRIGEMNVAHADMLLGADFFLSHRIYVSNSQNKVYFTYRGGPVFDLTNNTQTAAAPAADAPAPQRITSSDAPADAADYARRGAALASRQEFDQALGALDRACELQPTNAQFLYQRGMIRWHLNQPDGALSDFDQSLRLKPDDIRTRLERARLLLQRGQTELALADTDAAAGMAAKEANERYQLADQYADAERWTSAIAQYTLWIDSHETDAELPWALNGRCWARASAGVELELALKDCNAALKRTTKSSAFFAQVSDSLGLVYLRVGNYDKALNQYNAALQVNPKSASSLYGRGICRHRQQLNAQGDADLAAAMALNPRVADDYTRRGITP